MLNIYITDSVENIITHMQNHYHQKEGDGLNQNKNLPPPWPRIKKYSPPSSPSPPMVVSVSIVRALYGRTIILVLIFALCGLLDNVL